MKLSLLEEDNHQYYEILRRYNKIIDEWNELNNELHRFEVPLLFSPKKKILLIQIGKRIQKLQKCWLEHQHKAIDFALKPHFKFPRDTDPAIAIHLFHRNLIDRINHIRQEMTLLTVNFNERMSEVNHSRDFNIAIGSFVLGFIGLIVSLIAVFAF
ncbi:MAG: hypothetical protein ACE5K8_07245 [Candidatus Zixiibacteriota bacterium]